MIPFNKPYLTGKEESYILQALKGNKLSGGGSYTKRCQDWLASTLGCEKALLTHSCTGALEMAALLAEIGPGDEVILPSYTFVSTANAFVLRGAIPVFVDVRSDTLNMDERVIESAITDRTRAIVPVHYAGVPCEMDAILSIAQRRKLWVIEDAAQAILSTYQGKPAGSMGHLAALSFHDTKNIICGEGGALLINDPSLIDRAEIVWEKGTNRSQFFRGQVDKYTWVDVGSSFLPSEVSAAFLWGQLESSASIQHMRHKAWDAYHARLASLEEQGFLRRPTVPPGIQHNAHMYYVVLRNLTERTELIGALKSQGIDAVFHYVPLHSSPAGKRVSKVSGPLEVTETQADRLLRLPLWPGVEEHVPRIAATIEEFFHA